MLKHKEESYQVRGAVFVVYREMGCGFVEAVYRECLDLKLGEQGSRVTQRAGLAENKDVPV